MTEQRVIPGGTHKVLLDSAANNSNKTITVPVGKIWEVDRVYIQLLCTATVGARVLRAIFVDAIAAATTFVYVPSTNPTASQSCAIELNTRFSEYLTTIPSATLAQGTPTIKNTSFLPIKTWKAGDSLHVYDVGSIDAAADDLIILIDYIEYDA